MNSARLRDKRFRVLLQVQGFVRVRTRLRSRARCQNSRGSAPGNSARSFWLSCRKIASTWRLQGFFIITLKSYSAALRKLPPRARQGRRVPVHAPCSNLILM